MKTENTILLIGAAIAGYLLFAGGGKGEGGTGGSLITPAFPDWFTGVAPTASIETKSSSFAISEKILAAMNGSKKADGGDIYLQAANKALMPTPTEYSFPGQEGWSTISSYTSGESLVSKPVISNWTQLNTPQRQLLSGYDTYSNTVTTSKKAESTPIPTALSGNVGAIGVSQQGGATVYTQARSSGSSGGSTRSGFSW